METTPEQLDHTGLTTSSDSASEPSVRMRSRTDGDWLQDLMLHNVLSFALDESSYSTLNAVSEEWNRMSNEILPPPIPEMSLCVRDGEALKAENLELMAVALRAIQCRTSPLYRKTGAEGDSTTNSRSWPLLETGFNAVLMQLTHALSFEREPYRCNKQLYEMIAGLFRSVSESIVLSMWDAMGNHVDEPTQALQELLHCWTKWKGIVDTVEGICHCFNRYVVRVLNWEPLQECARTQFVQSVLTHLNDNGSNALLNFLRRLKQVGLQHNGPLLVEAWRICEMIRGFPWPEEHQSTDIRDAYLELAPLAEAAQDRMHEEEQEATNTIDELVAPPAVVTIKVKDGQVSLQLNSPFIQSSGFFRRLHLEGGESVKLLNVEKRVLEKAIEFSTLDAATPCPDIPSPLPSTDMVEAVGETFGNYIVDMEHVFFLFVFKFAHLVELDKLKSLCCAAVAAMIKARGLETTSEPISWQDLASPL